MDKTTEAQTTQEPDMMALAAAADAGTQTPEQTEGTSTPAQETPEKAAATADSAKEKPEEKQPAAKETEKQEKPESAYTKAKKDSDRLDRSWKALEQEKATFREERAALTAKVDGLTRELEQLRKQPAKPAAPVKDEHGFDAETYEKLSQKYAEEGDANMARLAAKKAAEMRFAEQKAQVETPKQTAIEPWKTEEFQTQWKANIAELTKADPTLSDPENPLVKAANGLLAHQTWGPFFKSTPQGIVAAVEVAKLQAAAGQLAEKTKALETANAEIQRLTKLTTPRSGPPGGPKPGSKSINQMSDEELSESLMSAAAAADAG